MTDSRYVIGVDTGGTFTDCVISGPGVLAVGKAFSTPGRLWEGILESIDQAAQHIGGTTSVLSRTTAITHGTTAMLNSVLTASGPVVGIITTAGFEDTLAIGRVHQRVAGLAEWEIVDPTNFRKSALFRDKRLILGVRERIDRTGVVLEPIDPREVQATARRLNNLGATAFAVNFLWSCVNSIHEDAAVAAIREVLPDASVTASSGISLLVGEYERFAASAVNAYISDLARGYIETLTSELRSRGFGGALLLMRSWGDLEQASRVAERAVFSLFSGPIGGVVGARALVTGLNAAPRRVMCADVGGTSFDIALLEDGIARWVNQPTIEKLQISVPMVEIASIGTGGGSIARFDPDVDLIHVGPQSAGANPGPACYGRGGHEPTLTDAAVVAGWIRDDAELPGGISLSADLARSAIEERIAAAAGMTVARAAISILRIACAQMADLVRKACVERAVDPRSVVPLIYGGAGAQYAGAIASELGLSSFLVPEMATSFSAFGMVTADEGLVVSQSLSMDLPVDLAWLEERYQLLEAKVRADLGRSEVRFERFAELKYRQQLNELRIDLDGVGPRDLDLAERFSDAYEERFGSGTAYRDAPVELDAIGVRGHGPLVRSAQYSPGTTVRSSSALPVPRMVGRFAWVDGSEHLVTVHPYDELRHGRAGAVGGPALISGIYTTVVVPPGWHARWNEDLDMLEVACGE